MRNVEKIQTEEQALTYAVCRAVILVGETLVNQNVILLPEVGDYFENVSQETIITTGVSTQHELHHIANSNWLLSKTRALKCKPSASILILYATT